MRITRLILTALLTMTAAAGAFAQTDVDVSLETFGISGAFRPGDFTGIRLQLKSNLSEPVQVQVVWEVPEGSGDIAEVTREIALTPGLPVSTWLYAKLLPTPIVDSQTIWAIRIYEDNDGERGAELGGAVISPATAMIPPSPVDMTEGMIAIVGGTATAALDDYNQANMNRAADTPITAHEITRLVSGLTPADLPDRWEGFDSFEAIVWTDASPGGLRTGQADAIREYVNRGGHLVIVLPSTGNDWGLGAVANHPLHDVLPTVAPRTETARLVQLLPAISKRRQIDSSDNIEFTVHSFDPATLDNGYEPLVALPKPDARVLAVQKLVGFGRITIVGLELQSGQLGRPRNGRGGGLIEGDATWNRILGRRADTYDPSQFKTLDDARALYNGGRNPMLAAGGEWVIQAISLGSGAVGGLLLAFLLFGVYWVLAGPVGFALLKTSKKVRHAWVVFALTSAVFTVVAWVGVKVFSQKHVQVQHLTFVDIVAPSATAPAGSKPLARATSWFTVFLPGYGRRDLSIESDVGSRDLLTSFTAPNAAPTRFPNIARYELPLRSPASYSVPTRATTKEMYARWMGTLPEEWAGGFEVVSPISIRGRGPSAVLTGIIGHNLPGELRNMRVLLVQPDRLEPKTYNDDTGRNPLLPISGQLLNITQIWGAQPLPQGRDFDLSVLTQRASFERDMDGAMASVTGSGTQDEFGQPLSRAESQTRYRVLSFYHMASPPEYRTGGDGNDYSSRPALKRVIGRELDLSPWLTRPCLIVIGEIENSTGPMPLRVDGEAVESTGVTVVRWIYPLPISLDDVAEEESRE